MTNSTPNRIRPLLNKPVAIFGSGVTGQALAVFFKERDIPCIVYSDTEKSWLPTSARLHNLVVYSPGFAPSHHWLQSARDQNVLCLPELDFASMFFPGKIIAVTGTNGKSTLVDMLSKALQNIGIDAPACGNIGTPFISIMNQLHDRHSIAICEVSSFQAESLSHFSPRSLFWTTLAEDHLDRHDSLLEYAQTKYNLVQRLNHNGHLFIGQTAHKTLTELGLCDFPKKTHCLDDASPQTLLQHSVREFFKTLRLDTSTLEDFFKSYDGLPHRLESITTIGKVHFINDSKATNFSAALSALNTKPETPIYWICGGSNKGGDLEAFAREAKNRCARAYPIGEVASQLSDVLSVSPCDSLKSATEQAFQDAQNANESAVVLLSPGFASFDMFDSYEDRGNIFKNLVLGLK